MRARGRSPTSGPWPGGDWSPGRRRRRRRAAVAPRRSATTTAPSGCSSAVAFARLGGHPSVATNVGGKFSAPAPASTSPPPVWMSSAAVADDELPAEETLVAPRRALLGGAAVEPREVPAVDRDRGRLVHQLVERPHPDSTPDRRASAPPTVAVVAANRDASKLRAGCPRPPCGAHLPGPVASLRHHRRPRARRDPGSARDGLRTACGSPSGDRAVHDDRMPRRLRGVRPVAGARPRPGLVDLADDPRRAHPAADRRRTAQRRPSSSRACSPSSSG